MPNNWILLFSCFLTAVTNRSIRELVQCELVLQMKQPFF